MRNIAIGLIGLLTLSGSAAAAAAPEKLEPVYDVSRDDAEMNAAKARAIASLPEFYRHLASPEADESDFMIKFDVVPGDGVEYVWAAALDRSAEPMTGVLINQPLHSDQQLGQRVPIAEADIVDWAYRRGRVMQGAYTHRVLLDRMPPEEAAAYRADFGWD
jgi:uncharacterized protein YegJ (DUF2314 family)